MVIGSQPTESTAPRRPVVALVALAAFLIAGLGAWFFLRGSDASYSDTNDLVAAMEEAGFVCHWKPVEPENRDEYARGKLDPTNTVCWIGDSGPGMGIEARLDRADIENQLTRARKHGSHLGSASYVVGSDWLLEIPHDTLPEEDAHRLAEALGAIEVVQIQAAETQG